MTGYNKISKRDFYNRGGCSNPRLVRVSRVTHGHIMNAEIIRYWINQPSTLDSFHNLHGVNVLGTKETDRIMRIYFLNGSIISQQIPSECLSIGWNNHGQCSDTYGLSYERMVITHRVSKDSFKEEWCLLMDGE